MKLANNTRDSRYEWLMLSTGLASLGACAEWLLLFGELPWLP